MSAPYWAPDRGWFDWPPAPRTTWHPQGWQVFLYGEGQLGGTGDLTSTAYAKVPAAVTLTGSGELTSSAFARLFFNSNLSGSGTLSVTISIIVYSDAALTGSGALSAASFEKYASSALLTGSGSLTSAAIQQFEATPSHSGAGNLVVLVFERYLQNGNLAGSGALSSDAYAIQYGMAILVGSGSLTATALQKQFADSNLNGSGSLTSASIQQFQQAVNLQSSGTLAATVEVSQVIFPPAFLATAEMLTPLVELPIFYHSIGAMARGNGAKGAKTFTHTGIPSGSNNVVRILLYVFVRGGSGGGTPTINTPVIGASTPTLLRSFNPSANTVFAVYELVAPPSGNQTCGATIDWTGSNYGAWMLQTVVYTGVDSITGSGQAASGAGRAAATTSAVPDEEVAVCCFAGDGYSSNGTFTGGTQRFQNSQNIVRMHFGDAAGSSTPAAINFGGGTPGASQVWGALWLRLRRKALIQQFTGVTYTQSNVYPSNAAADYTGMNNGSADGSANSQTGTTQTANNFFRADLGAQKYISHIVIGYDYLNNLPGGWGVSYTEGLDVQGSNDGSSWTNITTTPTYASSGSTNGLVTIPIEQTWRYVRLFRAAVNYMAVLEFQVWGA